MLVMFAFLFESPLQEVILKYVGIRPVLVPGIVKEPASRLLIVYAPLLSVVSVLPDIVSPVLLSEPSRTLKRTPEIASPVTASLIVPETFPPEQESGIIICVAVLSV